MGGIVPGSQILSVNGICAATKGSVTKQVKNAILFKCPITMDFQCPVNLSRMAARANVDRANIAASIICQGGGDVPLITKEIAECLGIKEHWRSGPSTSHLKHT